MIEQLFGSKTRVKLLRLFLANPNRPFYVREITRKIDEQINSVRRELANLLSIGIIVSDTANNKLYYEVNQTYEFYKPLAKIFGQSASDDASEPERRGNLAPAGVWKGVGNLELVLYTGHFTRDTHAPVDVLVVGEVTESKLDKAISELETQEGVSLRYFNMDLEECNYRRQVNDRFWALLESAKKQIVIDNQSIFK
jgi:hypothetical protein